MSETVSVVLICAIVFIVWLLKNRNFRLRAGICSLEVNRDEAEDADVQRTKSKKNRAGRPRHRGVPPAPQGPNGSKSSAGGDG